MQTNKAKILEYLEIVAPILPAPIYWEDVNSVVLGANELILKGIGAPSYEAVAGKTLYEFYPYEIADNIVQHNKEVIRTGEILSQEESIKDITTGEVKYFTAIKAPLRDDEGNIIGIVGTSIDITAEKEAEELRKQKLVAEEKVETMKMMAASIAHEIRTPLAAIKAQSSVIQTLLPTILEAYQLALEAGQVKKPLRKSQLEFLEHLPEELSRITSSANVFIDMLLTKVNFESLKDKNIQLIRLSMKNSVMDTLNHYPLDEYSARLLKCDYKNSFDFMGDEVLFQHVIFNLLKNAIYYVRAAGRSGEIKIWFERQQNQNILHFKDTGKGISKENLPNIFNSFYSRSRHGTGVGLAFCKMIVESFGGAITCDSVEDKYTHFMLSFPKVENAK